MAARVRRGRYGPTRASCVSLTPAGITAGHSPPVLRDSARPDRRTKPPNCGCVAYSWPHRPGGGLCRWPQPPLLQLLQPPSTHELPRLRDSRIGWGGRRPPIGPVRRRYPVGPATGRLCWDATRLCRPCHPSRPDGERHVRRGCHLAVRREICRGAMTLERRIIIALEGWRSGLTRRS